MSIESVMPSNHLILCLPLSSCLQSSPIRACSIESPLHVRGSVIIRTTDSHILLHIKLDVPQAPHTLSKLNSFFNSKQTFPILVLRHRHLCSHSNWKPESSHKLLTLDNSTSLSFLNCFSLAFLGCHSPVLSPWYITVSSLC